MTAGIDLQYNTGFGTLRYGTILGKLKIDLLI